MRAYLDWASAAPVHPRAKKAFMRALALYGNPSSPHAEGREAKELLEASRTRIARLCAVKSRAVIFTSGATEANALAIQGRVEACKKESREYANMHILYVPTMHASVIKTIQKFAKKGVEVEAIELRDYAIDLTWLEAHIRPETILIAADAVCGETGIRYDTLRIRRMLDALHHSTALLHVDASQLPLIESIDITRLGADTLTLDALKVGGVRGVGALIVPHHANVAPILQGGGQEAGLRPGTEPVALIAAFAEALSARSLSAANFLERATKIRRLVMDRIATEITNVEFIQAKRQAPHILNLSLTGIDTDYLVMVLDAKGYSVSTKSACETDSEEGSKVILALTGDVERAKTTLRISWGPETQEKILMKCVIALISSVRTLEKNTIY